MLKLSKAISIFEKKAQQMRATQAFDPNDIYDALRGIGLVSGNSLHFAPQYLIDAYQNNPSDVQISITLYPNGNVDVVTGSAFEISNLRNNFGMYARKAMALTNKDNIKKAIQSHFSNKNLTLPDQPITVNIPSSKV